MNKRELTTMIKGFIEEAKSPADRTFLNAFETTELNNMMKFIGSSQDQWTPMDGVYMAGDKYLKASSVPVKGKRIIKAFNKISNNESSDLSAIEHHIIKLEGPTTIIIGNAEYGARSYYVSVDGQVINNIVTLFHILKENIIDPNAKYTVTIFADYEVKTGSEASKAFGKRRDRKQEHDAPVNDPAQDTAIDKMAKRNMTDALIAHAEWMADNADKIIEQMINEKQSWYVASEQLNNTDDIGMYHEKQRLSNKRNQ